MRAGQRQKSGDHIGRSTSGRDARWWDAGALLVNETSFRGEVVVETRMIC